MYTLYFGHTNFVWIYICLFLLGLGFGMLVRCRLRLRIAQDLISLDIYNPGFSVEGFRGLGFRVSPGQ